MKKDEHFSEEQLNAFVDDELDPEEKSRLYNNAERSVELDQRLCRQRKVKELVKHAYDNVPQPARPGGATLGRGGLFGRMLAAGVLIAVGLGAGMLGHYYYDQNAAVPVVEPVAAVHNYLLHVTSGDPVEMHAALRYAEALLEEAEDGEERRVEIIANENGLDLLRLDVSPYVREITALQQSDVVFYACSRTIERLEDSGVQVQLVPHTNANYTALDRVVSRMQEGWKYEKI
jgi:intracellular sulfur oxidation DsrE/DsrF family protein